MVGSETESNHVKLNNVILKLKEEMNDWGQKVKEKLEIENSIKEKLNKVIGVNKSLLVSLKKLKLEKDNIE